MDSRPAATSAELCYWSQPAAAVLDALHSSSSGLSADSARARLQRDGPNQLRPHQAAPAIQLLLSQFKNPLVLILVFATVVSAFAREWIDASIVLLIIVGSALLSFRQEYHATRAIDALRARVSLTASVLRDGQACSIPVSAIVSGDIVLLTAGSLVPADGLLLTAKDCFVTEAVLTGESFPVEKQPGVVAQTALLAERSNCLFMGTSVRSGTATMVVTQTGRRTIFGQLAERLVLQAPATQFERGIRHFGLLLTQAMVIMVLLIITINTLAAKPAIESLLFAIALAVGLAPELLPAILSMTLAHGAQRMAAQGVIVRQLSAIENFGSMDVLCTDKTGTLTEGSVCLDAALDPDGQPAADVLHAAALNALLQTGLSNPLDAALVAAAAQIDPSDQRKIDEIPYDFERKRLSVVVAEADGARRMITKGALEPLLAICTHMQPSAASARDSQASQPHVPPMRLDSQRRAALVAQYEEWGAAGFRVLGVAVKALDGAAAPQRYTRADEQELTFIGYLRFRDPPKADARATINDLAQLGVQIKVITGDNRRVAQYVARQVGLAAEPILTGADLHMLSDEALWHSAEQTSLFVEVEPQQKERIIQALRKMSHVVGYLGDGINDAPALHAADVGISVDSAVDVAKEAATFVLLNHDLRVLHDGIQEGRQTFANTLKYIFTTTSANFGNMLSMAAMSLFLPFLPLLAKQILLNNFLSDVPAMSIASDSVDRELIERPRGWDIGFIRAFMLWFGLASSAFDLLTFGLLLFVFHSAPEIFRTGWFVESLLTELVIALVVRTRRPFYRSRPGRALWRSTLLIGSITLALPYLPLSDLLGLQPLPPGLLLALLGITAAYVAAVELIKRLFYRRYALSPSAAVPQPAPKRDHGQRHVQP